jgi:LL-diaminopimelate aminotransferase
MPSGTAVAAGTAGSWYPGATAWTLIEDGDLFRCWDRRRGLRHIALTLVDEGDTVLVPAPFYPVFADGPVLAGARLSYMPLRSSNGYILDLKDIPTEEAKAA